jgi:hypothetical protein
LAHVRHMLEPYGMTLMVRQDEAGTEFRPYPYSA